MASSSLRDLSSTRWAQVTRAPSGVLSPSPLRDGAGPAAPAASGQIYFTPDQFSARFGEQFFTAELIDRRTAADRTAASSERMGVGRGDVAQQLEARQRGEASHGDVVLDGEPARGGLRRGAQPGDGLRRVVRRCERFVDARRPARRRGDELGSVSRICLK